MKIISIRDPNTGLWHKSSDQQHPWHPPAVCGAKWSEVQVGSAASCTDHIKEPRCTACWDQLTFSWGAP